MFVKVVSLVVILGLIHGLVVLPIIYASIPFKKHRTVDEKIGKYILKNKSAQNQTNNRRIAIAPTKISIDPSPEFNRKPIDYLQQNQSNRLAERSFHLRPSNDNNKT